MKEIVLKIDKFIKKHDNIFFILIALICISGITLNIELSSGDELWNFQNIYKMYNGFEIYKDANVIITPLFFLIGELIFKIFGANFLTFRIYNIIIQTVLFFITYLLMKELKIRKSICIIILLALISCKKYYIILGQANYNTLSLVFCVLGIYLYLKKYKYNSVIQGIIMFLIFATKQNIGIYYAIGIFFCEILNNKNKREKIKNILLEFFVFGILMIIMCYFFYKNNNLYNFFNFAFLNINEFVNENFFIDISALIYIVFFIVINSVLTIIFIKNKRVNSLEKSNLIILECFSISLICITMPILNIMHFLLGIYLSVILLTYLVTIFFRELKIKISEKIIKSVLLIFLIIMSLNSIYSFVSYINTINSEEYIFEKEDPFYGTIYNEEILKNIQNIKKYIEDNPNNVVVLSHKAALYMVPLKKSNGMFDLPFKGNLGKNGENGLIEKIKKLKNTEILIEKDENNIIYQESKKVRKYIINNMDKIGEIEEFEIYYKE